MGIGHIQTGGKTHGFHDAVNALVHLFAAAADLVDDQGLGDELADVHAAVEAGIRVLKDHLHFGANLLQLISGEGDKITPLIENLPGGGLVEAKDGAAEGGLSAARLPHHADGFASGDGEGDIVHGVEKAAAGFEIFFQVVDLNDRFIHDLVSTLSPQSGSG